MARSSDGRYILISVTPNNGTPFYRVERELDDGGRAAVCETRNYRAALAAFRLLTLEFSDPGPQQ